MKIVKVVFVFITLLIVSVSTVSTVYAWPDWLTIKTEHFTVFYKPNHQDEAKQVLQTLEHYRPQVEKLCGNEEFHVSIVIDETGIYVNGFDDPLNSRIHLFRSHAGGWAGTENWWSLVGVHEYTHELSLTQTAGLPRVLTKIFGPGNFFFMPNLLAPWWIIEGITPYSESQITPYQGRLNDGLFDNYIAARVKDGRFTSILDATYSPLEFQESGIYTYGSEFFNYLAKIYGEEKLTQFFAVNGGQPGAILFTPAIGIDRSARRVFGKSFPLLWRDWQQYESERFKDFQYDGEQLTKRGWYIDNLTLNGGRLYYQRMYPVKTGAFTNNLFYEIVERDLQTGLEKTIVSTTTGFTSAFRVRNSKLYYATLEQRPGYANSSEQSYGCYALLHQYDLDTHKDRILLADEIRGYEVLPDGKIIYSKQRKNGFGSELYQYIPGLREKKLLFDSQYLINEIVGNAERLIVNAQRDWESCNIYSLNLEKAEFVPLIQTPYTERWLSLTGDRLFFTANYLKVNSVYCYDLGNGRISRLTQNGWVVNPVYDEINNKLYFAELNSFGYDLYQKTAEFKDYQLPDAPPTVPPIFTLDESEITTGTYIDNLKTMAPKFWFPVIDSDENEYGVMITGGDAVCDFSSYSVTIVYNTEKEKPMGELNLPINFFAPLQASIVYSDFDEDLTQMMLAYPFINRLSPGFSKLLAGVYLTRDEDYQGVEIKPFMTIGVQYPATNATLTISAPQSILNSRQERSAWYAELELKQYILGSEIRLSAQNIDDPANPDDVFTEIRGYEDALTDKQGNMFSVEFSRPLFKIRRGLWNPNVYLGDITGSIFNDQVIPENGKKQNSWGLELHLETSLAYNNLSLDWGYRFVQNSEGENLYQIFVKTVE
jgi:hypothetical protein